jgi:hypothetical protein
VAHLVSTLHDEGWRGWDPYDGLSSPAARFLRGSVGRQAWVQLHRRSPLNIRALTGVRARVMVKTAAVSVLAAARSTFVEELVGHDVPRLTSLLRERAGSEGPRSWWGYEFPVQTRWAYYEAGAPNSVVTSFVAQALLQSQGSDGNDDELLRRAGYGLVGMADESPGGPYFRYVPGSASQIYNASSLAASALARIGERFSEPEWVDLAVRVGKTIVAAQSPEGGWPYGTTHALRWEDGFHTAYVLLGLNQLREMGLESAEGALARGTRSFIDRFVTPTGSVRYYAGGRVIPEAHNVGTCLLALVDLREFDHRAEMAADGVARWGISQLWLPEHGRFATRKGRVFRNAIPYPRWSDGHMLLGLAAYLGAREGSASSAGR